MRGFYLHERPGVSGHALFGYSLSANSAKSCRQIEQYRSVQDLQSGLQDCKSFKESVYVYLCVCARVCPSCVQDSHTGMELLALKHEWLFHGPVEAPCSCLSEQEEKA